MTAVRAAVLAVAHYELFIWIFVVEPAHAVRIRRSAAEPAHQLVVDDHADRRADDRQQLGKFCQVDVVAILLLVAAPVEFVERCRQLLAVGAPFADPAIHIEAMRIAGECQLEHVQQVDALLVVFAWIAIERADISNSSFSLMPSNSGKSARPSKKPAAPVTPPSIAAVRL